MKTYEVELKRTSYIVITVEAEDEANAEELAWAELAKGGHDDTNADWGVESIERIIVAN
jgi:aspartate/glutamate racemase